MSQVASKSPAKSKYMDCVSAADKLNLLQLSGLREKNEKERFRARKVVLAIKSAEKKQL